MIQKNAIEPEKFLPVRFANWNGSAYNFIPQGRVDYRNHRQPGEWIIYCIYETSSKLLIQNMNYIVPEQNT